jgi:hypothetical protein
MKSAARPSSRRLANSWNPVSGGISATCAFTTMPMRVSPRGGWIRWPIPWAATLFFGDNQYTPHSAEGQRLLAHELAHTVQQDSASHVAFDKIDVSDSGDAAETRGRCGSRRSRAGRRRHGAAHWSLCGSRVSRRLPRRLRIHQLPRPRPQQLGPGATRRSVPNLIGEVSEAGAWVSEGDRRSKRKGGDPGTHEQRLEPLSDHG